VSILNSYARRRWAIVQLSIAQGIIRRLRAHIQFVFTSRPDLHRQTRQQLNGLDYDLSQAALKLDTARERIIYL
jgi:hypothetical protein